MSVPTILVACKAEAPITAWDLASGSMLTTYKQNASSRNGLCRVGRDHFASAQLSKGAIHFWTWHKDQVHQRSFAKEPILCLAATPCGSFVVAGTASGTIFCWEAGGGQLLREWAGHYKAVTSLCFTSDGHALLSGGDDAVLNVWLLADVLDVVRAPTSAIQPFHSWCEHSLPVTSVCCGAGGMNAIAASCSLDRTCKVYSLCMRAVLLTVALPASLHALALDPGQFSLYAGGGDGRIFEIPLVGHGADDSGDAHFHVLEGQSRAITTLSCGPDGHFLVSGSDDGTVCVFEMRSRQAVRTINSPSKAPISAVLTLDRPTFMPSGVRNVDQQGKGHGRQGPPRPQPLSPLAKYASSSQWQGPRIVLEGADLLVHGADPALQGGGGVSRAAGGQRDVSSLTGSAPGLKASSSSGEMSHMAQLEQEAGSLRAQLAEARAAAESWKAKYGELNAFCVKEGLA